MISSRWRTQGASGGAAAGLPAHRGGPGKSTLTQDMVPVQRQQAGAGPTEATPQPVAATDLEREVARRIGDPSFFTAAHLAREVPMWARVENVGQSKFSGRELLRRLVAGLDDERLLELCRLSFNQNSAPDGNALLHAAAVSRTAIHLTYQRIVRHARFSPPNAESIVKAATDLPAPEPAEIERRAEMLPLYAVLQSCQALQDQMLAAPTDELRQQQGRVAEIFGSRLRRAIEEASQAGQQHRAGGASSEIGLFLGQVKQNGLLAAALLRMTGHDRLGLSAANRRWLTEALCSESILTKKPGETAVDPDQVSVPLLGIYVSKARKAIEFWPGGDWAFYLEARTCLRGEAPSIRSKYQCLMDDPTSQRTPPGTESRRPGAEGYEVVFHKDSGERFEEQGQMSKSLLELTWAEHAGETFELLPSKKKAG